MPVAVLLKPDELKIREYRPVAVLLNPEVFK
jgi:hypothetical protein